MLNRKSSFWFNPKSTGDPGRDRNARTLQFACLLLAFAVGVVVVLNVIQHESEETPVLVCLVAGSIFAAVMNRKGRWTLAAGAAFLAVLLTAFVLVLEARDGFRSHAMLVFPGLLLVSVMFLNRAFYMTTAGIVLLAVAALGIADKHGLTRAIPGVRTPTTYESILDVDLNLLVFAAIGSRIARDAERNVLELHATIERIAETNRELRETTMALRENEQQLVSIYDTVRDVIFYLAVEPEGQFRFVSVNATFLRVTGLSREMVVGKTLNEVIPEPSLTMVLGKYRQAIEEKTTVVWEETSDYPTGRLTGQVTVVPAFDKQGICTHLVGSVHDITERKQAEAMLHESEERFRNMADTAPVMIWVAGLDKRCSFLSKTWLDFTGRTMDQELSNGAEGVHPEDRERSRAIYFSSFDAQCPFRLEYRLQRADHEYRWILENGTPLYRGGEFVGYICSCIDITEQKLTEERLRASEARLMNAQRLAKVGSWERDTGTDRIYWSDEVLRILGKPNGPPSNFSAFLDSVHPKDREQISEADRKVRSSSTPVEVEYRIVRPDGEVRFVRSVAEG